MQLQRGIPWTSCLEGVLVRRHVESSYSIMASMLGYEQDASA